MQIRGVICRSASICALLAVFQIGPALFFEAPVARAQSSLESDVDNARIIEMTHKGLGDDVYNREN